MGRTKRLRKKRNGSVPDQNDFPVSLYHYMSYFNWNNDKKLSFRNFTGTGRGLCSKTNIFSGDVIVKLPLEAMITLATIENDMVFHDITKEFVNSTDTIPFQSLLALYLLFQKHQNNSLFELYLASIPLTFSTPYFCKSNELYFLPEIILQKTVNQNKEICDSYTKLQNALSGKICSCCGQLFFREVFKLHDFKWAYFAVNTRSVFFDNNIIETSSKNISWCRKLLCDKPDMALAPFLDMFNHSNAALTEAQIVKENNSLHYQLITKNSFKSYEQIFISYGKLTNFKLFTEYGFSLENNFYDYFEITLSDIEQLIKSERQFKGLTFHSSKFKFIRDHNLNDQMFIHNEEGLSHNLQVVLYLIFKEPSYFPNVLNQTAFGSNIVSENSVHKEAKLLILYKIKEYQAYVEGLSKLNELSCSGRVSDIFLKQCLTYLQTSLTNFL